MAAAGIPANALPFIDRIHEGISMAETDLEEINNLATGNAPMWGDILEKITDTELDIMNAKEDVKELQTLDIPVHMRASIDAQAERIKEMYRLIGVIKRHTVDVKTTGDAEDREDLQSGLNDLLPLAHETRAHVANLYDQVHGLMGGKRSRRSLRVTKRSMKSKRSKRSKRSMKSKRSKRTHRKQRN